MGGSTATSTTRQLQVEGESSFGGQRGEARRTDNDNLVVVKGNGSFFLKRYGLGHGEKGEREGREGNERKGGVRVEGARAEGEVRGETFSQVGLPTGHARRSYPKSSSCPLRT